MENKYVIFGIYKDPNQDIVDIYIRTTIIDYNEAWELVKKMNLMFPLYKWDSSNAKWTKNK